MYNGKHLKHESSPRRRASRPLTLVISAILLIALAVGGTVAFLTAHSGPVTNSFAPGDVTTTITEEFDGTIKKNVSAKNTGSVNAYIRVKLISYRVNDKGDHIGGETTIPTFTPGTGWVEYGGYYYYTNPVAPGATITPPLIDVEGITLTDYSKVENDADGGKQAIDVIAEAIQAEPANAVQQAWGVTISDGSVTAYTGN